MKRLMTLALICCGCATGFGATGSKGSGIKSADLYPLSVGNTWSYTAEMLGEKKDISITIVSEDNGLFTDTTGAKMQVDVYGVRDDKRYLVREPIEQGTRWNNVVSVSSMESYQITSVGNRCQTIAGNFDNCVVVEGRNQIEGNKALVNEMTFVPGVGLVRISVVLDNDGRHVPQTSLELTKYELKNVNPPTSPLPAPAIH